MPGVRDDGPVGSPESLLVDDVAAVAAIRAGLAGKEKLRSYDSDDDQFSRGRYVRFGLFVILPTLLMCGAIGWVVTRPAQGLGGALPVLATVPSSQLAAPLRGTPVARVGGSMFGPSDPGAGLVNLSPVRCYARVDARGVYSETAVLMEGMVVPTKFTRVNGGMIWSDRFGWLHWGDFGCRGEIESLEVEFVPPGVRTATRRVVTSVPVVVRGTPTTSSVVVVASPTLWAGIHLFELRNGCDLWWLVWGVDRVFLEFGSTRVGVGGDVGGLPASRSVCGYVGIVRLIAYGRDGLVYSRFVEVR